jgi:hypothetical protein
MSINGLLHYGDLIKFLHKNQLNLNEDILKSNKNLIKYLEKDNKPILCDSQKFDFINLIAHTYGVNNLLLKKYKYVVLTNFLDNTVICDGNNKISFPASKALKSASPAGKYLVTPCICNASVIIKPVKPKYVIFSIFG